MQLSSDNETCCWTDMRVTSRIYYSINIFQFFNILCLLHVHLNFLNIKLLKNISSKKYLHRWWKFFVFLKLLFFSQCEQHVTMKTNYIVKFSQCITNTTVFLSKPMIVLKTFSQHLTTMITTNFPFLLFSLLHWILKIYSFILKIITYLNLK